jgi:hypothetical protein
VGNELTSALLGGENTVDVCVRYLRGGSGVRNGGSECWSERERGGEREWRAREGARGCERKMEDGGRKKRGRENRNGGEDKKRGWGELVLGDTDCRFRHSLAVG